MAIQVSGTPIITDAKALNGITSIDTTTKNAFSAGGVGGLTTLISSGSVGTGTTFELSFSGNYKMFRIVMHGLSYNSATAYGSLRARLKDSSNTAITSGYYSYSREFSSSAGFANDGMFLTYIYGSGRAGQGVRWTSDVLIHDPYSTSTPGLISSETWQYNPTSSGTEVRLHQSMGMDDTAQRYNSIYFYWFNGTFNFNAGTYEFYGIN
jgi:hypothetical protein